MELAKQIELAPKNGDFIVLQDGRSGSWEVGRWAPETSSWVRIDGKPLRIFPTHWVSASGDSVGSENAEGLPFLVPAIQPPKRLRIRFILAFTVAAIFFFGGYAALDFGFTGAGPAKDSSFDTIVLSAAELNREVSAERVREPNAVCGMTGVVPNTQGLDELTAGTPTSSSTRGAPIPAVPEPFQPPARPPQSQPTSAISVADEARLIARAEFLIKQSDFSGARLLLEYALEKGSAHAAFMMAETYDWRMLRSKQAYGVREDAEKAQELYELAAVAGIEKARERLEALKSSSLPRRFGVSTDN
jgi:hypothetical protein